MRKPRRLRRGRWAKSATRPPLPAWLDLAHKKLDAAMTAAFVWPADLSDDQILELLLALNLERAAEEAKARQSPKRKPAQREKAGHEMIRAADVGGGGRLACLAWVA
jgi:hypothetical protein